MVAGLRCPPPPSGSPIPCSPVGLDLPCPHPIPPASSRASPPGPRPTICRPSPARRVCIWGLRNPRKFTPTCLGGVRLGTDSAWRCSAYDWLRVPWAGLAEKRDAVTPPTLYRSVLSLGEGPWDGLAHSPAFRGVEGHRAPSASGDITLFCFPNSFRSLCPPVPARGWSPARPIRTAQLGQTPILSKATIEKNFGFTRNVGDCLLYISTFHSTK